MISIQQMEVYLVVVIITTIIPTFKHECSASGCSLTGLQYSSHLTFGCDLVDSDGSLRKTLWTINLPFAFFFAPSVRKCFRFLGTVYTRII